MGGCSEIGFHCHECAAQIESARPIPGYREALLESVPQAPSAGWGARIRRLLGLHR